MAQTIEYKGGVGFGGLLAVLFIGLKLTGHIDWSWWWVLSPLWIPLVLVLACCALFVLGLLGVAAISVWMDSRKAKKRRTVVR